MRPIYLTSAITLAITLLGTLMLWLTPNPLGGEPFAVIELTDRAETLEKMKEEKSARITKELMSKNNRTAENNNDPIYFENEKNRLAKAAAKRKDIKRKLDEADKKLNKEKLAGNSKIENQRPEYKALPPAPHSDMIEQGQFGPIPRIANDGRRPQIAYAHPNNHYHIIDHTPAKQITIIITDLGLSEPITKASIEKLPAPVTFTFSPYGRSLENWMRLSRQKGHELLLELPMEPFDYPDNDPGPRALLTQLSDAVNLNRLHWVMSKMGGYIGMINLTGTKFSADEGALFPILREFKNRGLIYIDGNPQAPVTGQKLANELKLDYLKSGTVIDEIKTAEDIDKSLKKLENEAIKHGKSVGIAAALPLTIERIVKWSKTLEKRGIVLVPLSAAIPSRQS